MMGHQASLKVKRPFIKYSKEFLVRVRSGNSQKIVRVLIERRRWAETKLDKV